ncbi:hypothetical protein I2F27_12045 [Acinetobacter sp. B5B]|uniref:hypothetical protein n=1 Tax=Acinetobacter baretiae TaxID=2605383 RepID=UPI0018C34C7F|nr:hypothetical protein [Acinetobacter baretiae]MBF7684019.1 hypothetical protein [Acinetobacter baretiae]MBF7684029.1 hypothetical protein [Acinetobacter baretiae]
MSEQHITAMLTEMSSTLQILSQVLEHEKTKHFELLNELNTRITNSQENIKTDIHDFITNIELTELVSIVHQSSDNIKKQQTNLQHLDNEIQQISTHVNNSIETLEHNTELLTEKIEESSQLIASNLIKQISLNVKDSITTQFINQFKEQNQKLVSEISEANETAVRGSIVIYKRLTEVVETVKEQHHSSLEDFRNHVDSFNKKMTAAIKRVDQAFLDVQEKNKQNMDKLYDSCATFQEQVIEKLNTETAQINKIFDQKITDLSKRMDDQISQSFEKMSDIEQKINEKNDQITANLEKNTDKNLGITQKIIEKQEVLYRNLCDKLTIKYFSLNTISILFVVLIVLVGFNIAASKRYSEISDFNNALASQNQKLMADNTKLLEIKNDSLRFTKQSITEVRKKFPQFQILLDCKSLD